MIKKGFCFFILDTMNNLTLLIIIKHQIRCTCMVYIPILLWLRDNMRFMMKKFSGGINSNFINYYSAIENVYLYHRSYAKTTNLGKPCNELLLFESITHYLHTFANKIHGYMWFIYSSYHIHISGIESKVCQKWIKKLD